MIRSNGSGVSGALSGKALWTSPGLDLREDRVRFDLFEVSSRPFNQVCACRRNSSGVMSPNGDEGICVSATSGRLSLIECRINEDRLPAQA